MSGIEFLKAAKNGRKPFRSFANIALGTYPILSFDLVNDKNFGRRLRAETKDFIITLPERFINNLTDEILADLNKERYVMTYKGKDETKHNMVLLDFEKISK